MIQLHKAFLFLTYFLTILGCEPQDKDITTIDSLINRFPQLQMVSNNRSHDYNLVRSVLLENPSITIKLYSQPDSVDDKQQIILVTNSNLHSYWIPVFSNTYRDYWKFQSDSSSLGAKRINSTFEKELNTCLDSLNLNDTIGTAGKVVNEILYSLLHCQDISISDSSNFLNVIAMNGGKNTMPEEDSDSCYKRFKRNWDIISREMPPNKTIIYKHSYWDKDNERIYQFDFKDFKRKKKSYFMLNTFRQDCNRYFITM